MIATHEFGRGPLTPSPSRDRRRRGGTSPTAVVDEPDRQEVRVAVTEPSLVVIADAWSSGWSATVDGVTASILPADVGLRAVPVPAGDHVVVLTFRPPGSPWASWAGLGAAVAALALLLLGRSVPLREE